MRSSKFAAINHRIRETSAATTSAPQANPYQFGTRAENTTRPCLLSMVFYPKASDSATEGRSLLISDRKIL